MGKPYSLHLRERIVGYVAEGHAARVFGVSASTAVRWAAAYRRDGSIAAKPQGRTPGTKGKLVAHIRRDGHNDYDGLSVWTLMIPFVDLARPVARGDCI